MVRAVAAPRVYLITDRRATDGRPIVAVIAQALRAVADNERRASQLAVQLREKDLGGRELLQLARELRAVTAAAGVRLFINDRIDVALAVKADGVHLGGGALTPADVAALAPNLQIAVSTHSPSQVAAVASAGGVSFVVFGPVFDTPSKRAFGPPAGLAALREACAFSIPVLALGGVQANQIPSCFEAGASGVASIGAVLRNAAPDRALRTFFGAIEST